MSLQWQVENHLDQRLVVKEPLRVSYNIVLAATTVLKQLSKCEVRVGKSFRYDVICLGETASRQDKGE